MTFNVYSTPEAKELIDSLKPDEPLRKSIEAEKQAIKHDIEHGDRIEKNKIPERYKKLYHIDNLYHCVLIDGWRMMYTIIPDRGQFEGKLAASILEVFPHKKYADRMGYHRA